MLNRIHAATESLLKALTFLACCFLVYVVFACVMQVFSRYVLNSSFAWTEETARFAFAIMGMLGAPVALRKGMHVNVDLLESRLPEKLLRVQKIALDLLLLVAAVILLRYGFLLFMGIGKTTSPAMKIPMRYVYASVPISGLFSIWVLAVDLLDCLSGEKRGGRN